MCKNKVLPFQWVLHLINISLALSLITSKKKNIHLLNVREDIWTDKNGYFGCFIMKEVSWRGDFKHLHCPILACDFFFFSPPNSCNNLILVPLFDHWGWDGTFWTASKANVCSPGSIWQMRHDLTNWLCADVTFKDFQSASSSELKVRNWSVAFFSSLKYWFTCISNVWTSLTFLLILHFWGWNRTSCHWILKQEAAFY